MNRIQLLLLLSLLCLPSVSAQAPEKGELPLRGMPQVAPTDEKAGQNPLDFGRSTANTSTPISDSLHTPLQSAAPGADAKSRPYTTLSANFSAVSATAKLLDSAPLFRCRDDNLKFVEITLRNDSSEVALVHGDIAEAKVGDHMRTAASARYIGTVASPKLNTKGRVYTGLALAGSWGLAGPMFYELVTPNQHAKRYLGTAIGVDGSRHEIEDQRFGLRVLMPGEETVGWLAFECPPANDLTSLLIPVNYSKSALPSGSLFVQVKPGNGQGGATVQPASSAAASVNASASAIPAAGNAAGSSLPSTPSVKAPNLVVPPLR